MKMIPILTLCAVAATSLLPAQTALTIYNQNFAVVRDTVPLDLKAGDNVVPYAGVTAQLETDSVVLRDPAGKVPLQIVDQSYRADTLSQPYLLSLNEGKTLDFIVRDKDNKEYKVKGKIISSGYVPAGVNYSPSQNYNTTAGSGGVTFMPIIEVDGQMRFSLPGDPVFDALGDDTILKPTLTWKLQATAPAKLDAELSYISNGFTWKWSYNLVAPEKGNQVDFVGWLTMTNSSGKTFTNASIQLVAGDVNKIQNQAPAPRGGGFGGAGGGGRGAPPPVTERAFDEYHLYNVARPTTLRDRETKQVEFVSATNVTAQLIYVYDGAAVGNYRGFASANTDPNYGNQSNKKVWVMRELKNTKENGLGMPLPAGRMRFYRRDEVDNRLEFVGENNIDHTPEGETLRVYTGDSFDIVGERTRMNYVLSERNSTFDETFEVKVRNHKADPVEVRVVEHLYRWFNWAITAKSDDFIKTDAQTIEFRETLKPEEEKVITYTVHYDWK